MTRFRIRPTVEDDWRDLRALRLEMLSDTPRAYAETLAHARSLAEEEWRMRALRSQNPHSTQLVAVDGRTGRWAGTMAGYVDEHDGTRRTLLVGVYVSPAQRGGTLARALLAAVEEWAAGEGDRLFLNVHEDNARAIAFYESCGFRRTGSTHPYVLDASEREVEMVKDLSPVRSRERGARRSGPLS